ncbi:MAG: insulinase family protein [Phycisphaeraceae bacterium]|nr:insulinase family protein [Phycisphaeraceae bacterium]
MPSIMSTTLANGLKIAMEPMDSVRSASLAWLVPAGAAMEPQEYEGLGAMWSELLMRGAGGLNSRAQADAFDRLGASRGVSGQTFFLSISSTFLGNRIDDVLPLVAEMVLQPTMDAIEPARDLALQSLESLVDEPAERTQLEAKRHHRPSPINRSGLGTPESLARIDKKTARSQWERLARPDGAFMGIAGSIDPDRVLARLERIVGDWHGATPMPPHGLRGDRGVHHVPDEGNQVQIVVCHDAPREADADSILERVVLAVLSGGMAGRLFTEVREKRGLCYDVHASYGPSRDFGTVSAYVGTSPERAQESLDVLLAELERINGASPVTPDEFERAIVGMKSRLVFSGESTGARAAALVSDLFRLERARTLEDWALAVDAVTLDQVNGYLARRTLGSLTIQTLGPVALSASA